ncbi:MAG: DEAD/DEAH box helicase, partial [Candidatus Eremiobacteraeota bacterium]|nr:DEAD/DEAH box helicase [Candidatus Eremiobacteraeota bacterium]
MRVPRNPLDVLAQQIVAESSLQSLSVDDLKKMVRRAASFSDLSDEILISLLDMLSGRFPSTEFAELKGRINWDREQDLLEGRPGSKMLSLVNAGTIPDRGLYAVYAGSDGPRLGELDEEMVHEMRPGQNFLLGASTWRVQDITRDRVIVSPAPGEPGQMPFWRGEGPGRPIELGKAIGAYLRQLDSKSTADRAVWLEEHTPLDTFA